MHGWLRRTVGGREWLSLESTFGWLIGTGWLCKISCLGFLVIRISLFSFRRFSMRPLISSRRLVGRVAFIMVGVVI